MTSYAAVIERADDGGYGAWCPELPGRSAASGELIGNRGCGQPHPCPAATALSPSRLRL